MLNMDFSPCLNYLFDYSISFSKLTAYKTAGSKTYKY